MELYLGWSRGAAGGRSSPGQEVSSGNEADTRSRGTRPAAPLRLGLTLKED